MCWHVHYWVSVSETHTIVSSMSSFVCMVHPGIVASSLQSAQLVIRITRCYCHHVHLPSPFWTNTTLEWHWQKEREKGGPETRDERPASLQWHRERRAAETPNGKICQVSALPMCCYLAHTHPTMFYIHLVLGLHTFQHSVGRRKTNFTSHPFTHISPPPWNFFSLLPPSPRHQSHPLLTPFSPPFSPSPQYLSILYSLCHHWQQYQFVRSAFNQTLDTHLITVEITGDY